MKMGWKEHGKAGGSRERGGRRWEGRLWVEKLQHLAQGLAIAGARGVSME